MAAYDSQIIDRILPKIKQWEATMGRRISPQMLESMMKAEIGAESDRATEVAFRNRQLNLQENQAKKEASAAKVKGVVDIASTAGNLALGYKALKGPKPTTTPTPDIGNTGTDPAGASYFAESTAVPTTTGTSLGSSVPSSTAPAYTGATPPASVTSGMSGIEYGTTAGGQSILAGSGNAAVGGQTALAEGTGESLAAYDAAIAEGAAEGVGTAGTAGASTSYLMPAVAGIAAFGAAKPLFKKISKEIHNATEYKPLDESGAGKSLIKADKDVEQVFNNILGDDIAGFLDVSVICSELTRQGELSERDRTKCVVYRWRHIPDDMFVAYLEWATPIVALMKKGGITNMLLLPFCKAFVGYMVSVQNAKEPRITQRIAWKYAWWRCSRIAVKHGAKIAREVA